MECEHGGAKPHELAADRRAAFPGESWLLLLGASHQGAMSSSVKTDCR